MLTYRLVRLIETHSEDLAARLLETVQHSEFTRSYSNVPAEELRQRVYEIYQHLGDWLLAKTDTNLKQRYHAIGACRYEQNVPLAELVWAIVVAKETLCEFLTWEFVPTQTLDVFGELELLQLLNDFFDRATHYAVLGYEQAREEQYAPQARHRSHP